MKVFTLKKDGAIRVSKGEFDLSLPFIEESCKSCTPGELVQLVDKVKKKKYHAFLNPLSQAGNEINLINNLWDINLESVSFEEYLKTTLNKAKQYREIWMEYQDNARLFYANADGLPGLVVDSYVNYIIIQINSAGVDRFREFVKNFYQTSFPNKKIIFLDNEKYRSRQGLPIFPKEELESNLMVKENDFLYEIRKEVLQKVGYYYDHRENRKKAERFIKKADIELNSGLDLFSYVGSWGMHLLRAGLKQVDFVDQGNFEIETQKNLSLNGFEGRGSFYRDNVFKYLDKLILEEKRYEVVCSDPPAFAKSKKEKNAAMEGYLKLHKKVLKVCADEAIIITASCTHYVNHEEFQKTVADAAQSENVNLTLLDCGVQGLDHPSRSTHAYNNYIKFYLYLVRKK